MLRGLSDSKNHGVVTLENKEEYFTYWNRLSRSYKAIEYKLPPSKWIAQDVIIKALRKNQQKQSVDNIALVRKFFNEYKEIKENEFR